MEVVGAVAVLVVLAAAVAVAVAVVTLQVQRSPVILPVPTALLEIPPWSMLVLVSVRDK